jgi:hypothetical protein
VGLDCSSSTASLAGAVLPLVALGLHSWFGYRVSAIFYPPFFFFSDWFCLLSAFLLILSYLQAWLFTALSWPLFGSIGLFGVSRIFFELFYSINYYG